jgi:hypothetical protein
MPRFSVDYLDLLLDLFRSELDPTVNVMTRIPDLITSFLPLVVVRSSGGDSYDPRFFDTPYINVQSWCAPPADQGADGAVDASRAASDLADECRRILWTAWREQRVIAGLGWISKIRESSGPLEVPDVDAPALGRWVATYELRIRNAA